ESATKADEQAIEAMGDALAGSDRPLVITSGVLGLGGGRVGAETDAGTSPRAAGERAALALADRGVRSSSLRLPPSVHGRDDHGFVPRLIEVARERGVSGYVDDGATRWSAVHRLDAARLFRLAVERAPAGSVLHGVGDEGVLTRSIAEV